MDEKPGRALASVVLLVAAAVGCPQQPAARPNLVERASRAGDAVKPAVPARGIVREPAVAGQFYPADPGELRAAVRRLMAGTERVTRSPARMVLAPHAGYPFSGAVAAASFRQLDPGFERVVILAGNHNGAARFAGASVDQATRYRVPGLEVEVAAAAAALRSRPGFVDVPEAHTMHMIEVELPFLAEVNGKPFEIVPIVVGQLAPAGARDLARELAALADARTRFVFSIDLSHYHPWAEATDSDRRCLAALEKMDAGEVARCDTDATQLLLVMTELGALQGWTPRLVTYANSGDVTGERGRVVGYGAMVYEDEFRLSAGESQALLALARRALEAKVTQGRDLDVPQTDVARLPRLGTPRGAFVTLRKRGQLRGCIGSLEATQALAEDVVRNASRAAVADPRFLPVEPAELGEIKVSISVLDTPRPLLGVTGEALARRLGAEHPGLIIEYRGRSSTFLPEVWAELPDAVGFLGHLCRKQGSPEDCWRQPEARFLTYGAQHLGE